MSKITCSQCGEENPSTSKFCASCGYALPKIATDPAPEASAPSATKKTKNTIPGVIVGVVVFFLAFFAVQHLFFSEPTFNKAMIKIAAELNKETPMMVDAETRLDNVIVLPGNVFQYNYTILTAEVENVDLQGLKDYL